MRGEKCLRRTGENDDILLLQGGFLGLFLRPAEIGYWLLINARQQSIL